MTLALTPPPPLHVPLTKAQADFLARTALQGHRGKSVTCVADAQAALNLTRLGFVRFEASPRKALPMVYPTSLGLGWLADELLRCGR